MSRQRANSRYRRFPWDEPDFNPQKVIAELDGMPRGRNDPEENWDDLREEGFPGPQRSSPQFQQRERCSEESYHRRRVSPYHDQTRYPDGGDGQRRREKFRENPGRPEDRGWSRSSHTSSHTQRSHSIQREQGLRQDETERGRDRFRDRSPLRTDERPQRNTHSPEMNRRRPNQHQDRNQDRNQHQDRNQRQDRNQHQDRNQDRNQHQDRNQPIKRHRREVDDSSQLGYSREEPLVQRYSVDDRREGFSSKARGPLVFEHSHGVVSNEREPPRREQFSRDREFNQTRQRSPRSFVREDTRGGHFEENRKDDSYRELQRSPFTLERESYTQNRDGPMNRGGMRGNYNRKGCFNRGGGGPQSNRPQQLQHQHQRDFQNPQNVQQRPQFREKVYEEEEPDWEEQEQKQKTWSDNRGVRGGLVSQIPRQDVETQLQREQRGRTELKPKMMVVTEETLTIKVDMSRPVNKNSSMLYSSDRQLSLDLVNVGRQRLDFLPMLEHSGTYCENTVHTGTFAQEIITLVHLVKEQYFGGEGITLNKRFSAPQKAVFSEEEPHEMTLSERFSSNSGIGVNAKSLLDTEEPLFSRQGTMQLLGSPPARDPDDLRHDLERRRQERLEGVKVTIAGQSLPQRPLRPKSEQTYSDNNDMSPMDEEGFSNWSEELNRRQDGSVAQRRGGPFRPNTASFRRNNRQMRQPNYRNNTTGPNW